MLQNFMQQRDVFMNNKKISKFVVIIPAFMKYASNKIQFEMKLVEWISCNVIGIFRCYFVENKIYS